MLYGLIILPIESIVDWIFNFMLQKLPGIGIIGAIGAVSFVINLLALPLYAAADREQEHERALQREMQPQLKRIRSTFRSDERFMMLSAYYRERGYHPIFALRSALSLLVEIPFFIAAYHFLSHCDALKGASFGILRDLSAPDGLLPVASVRINVLPFVMTAINLLSAAVYARNLLARDKVQLFGAAAVFFVLLYNAPSGLEVYWILNNLFSLAKNLAAKTKKPLAILHLAASVLCVGMAAYFLRVRYDSRIGVKMLVVASAAFVVLLPLIQRLGRRAAKRLSVPEAKFSSRQAWALLLSSGAALALFLGFMLPGSTIASSPAEFSYLGNTASPLSYIWSSVVTFTGFFVLYPVALARLTYSRGGYRYRLISSLLFLLLVLSIAHVFLFAHDYGNLTVDFSIQNDQLFMDYAKKFTLYPLLFFCTAALGVFLVLRLGGVKLLTTLALSVCVGATLMGVRNVSIIRRGFAGASPSSAAGSENAAEPVETLYHLSQTGLNVIVLFLDRGIGPFVPHILAQFPETAQQFRGFTHYPNCVSFSSATVTGAPAMVSGYEYTQERINARSDELLREKNNEAILAVPKVFADAGFSVVLDGAPWTNYAIGGNSLLSQHPEVSLVYQAGRFTARYIQESGFSAKRATAIDERVRKEIRNFMVLQALPPLARATFNAHCRRGSKLVGMDMFLRNISGLYYLDDCVDTTSTTDTFTFICSDTAHDVFTFLDERCELPAFEQPELPPYCATMDTASKMHYQANCAALRQYGRFFDSLRARGVWDNTRIVIVSDHGFPIDVPEFQGFAQPREHSSYAALLMVKDFNAADTEMQTSDEFMTNADAPLLEMAGLGLSIENPFTQQPFRAEKDDGVTVFACTDWNPQHFLDATVFALDDEHAYHVSGSIFDERSWLPYRAWKKAH